MSYTTTITADSPLLFYELDETSGTSATDASGNSHTGTYAGGYTQAQAPLITTGTSVKFNGTSAKVTTPSLSTVTGDFSAEFWAEVTPPGGYTQADNFPAYGGSTTSRMIVRPGGYYFSVWIGGTEQTIQFTPGGDVHTNKTVYWCFQRSGTSLLLHRAIVGTDSAPVQVDSLAGVATTAVTLTGSVGNDPTGGTWMNGYIDEFALYSVALSSTQRNAHYTAGITPGAGGGGLLSMALLGVGG